MAKTIKKPGVEKFKEDILAKHLRDALMCILSELGEEFHDKDGDELEHKDGGDISMGGEMSGYGEWSFEFKKAERALVMWERLSKDQKFEVQRKFAQALRNEHWINELSEAIQNMSLGAKEVFIGRLFDIQELLCDEEYLRAPASRGHHLARRGGLAEHSKNVTLKLIEISEALGIAWPKPDSILIVGFFHDLVKTQCYVKSGESDGYDYEQPLIPGHGTASLVLTLMKNIELEPEEIAAITYHMGLYGTEKFASYPEYSFKEYNNAMDKFAPYIIATHTADMFASQVMEKNEK